MRLGIRPSMNVVHLAGGIAIRDNRILLVASRYPTQPAPLWNLPGGRLQPGELFHEAALREIHEETGYHASIASFAYLSESYDEQTHFVSAVFEVSLQGERTPAHRDDHVVAVEWCKLENVARRLQIAVVRDPLLTYLARAERYFSRHDAGITIRWDD